MIQSIFAYNEWNRNIFCIFGGKLIDYNDCNMKSALIKWDLSDETNIEKNGNINIEHLQTDRMDIYRVYKKMFFLCSHS